MQGLKKLDTFPELGKSGSDDVVVYTRYNPFSPRRPQEQLRNPENPAGSWRLSSYPTWRSVNRRSFRLIAVFPIRLSYDQKLHKEKVTSKMGFLPIL